MRPLLSLQPVLFLLLHGFLSCSCTTTKKAPAEPPVKLEYLEDIPMESNASVQRSADIRAYPVGRYVDAANKNVMHERHVIYRRERPEQWRLNSDRGAGILLGPTVGLRNPVALRNPTSQELSAELNKQRIVTRQLLQIQQRAASGDERAQALMAQAVTMRDNQEKLVKLIEDYNSRLDQMQRQMDAIPRPVPPAAPPTTEDAPTKTTGKPAPPKKADPAVLEVPKDALGEPGITLPFRRR